MGTRLYPLKFNTIFRETPWGGNRLLEVFGKGAPGSAKIGESWEIVDRDDYNSIASNGHYRGLKLRSLLEQHGSELLGTSSTAYERFPLLVKFLDITERLSLQVHPDDAYAMTRERDGGKTEAWYIIKAEPGSWVVQGLKQGASLETLEDFLIKGDEKGIESCLNFRPVRPGDLIFIPAGTPHSAGGGILLLEIQQNSDLTYRLYDWGSDRSLQIDKAMDVLKTTSHAEKAVSLRPGPGNGSLLLKCDKFAMELLELKKEYQRQASSFHILTFINGKGDIYYGKGEYLEAHAGDNILVPAMVKDYKIYPRATCKLVLTSC